MTLHRKYIRLEAAGLWRSKPGAQRREVLVYFSNASLIISDFNEQILSHWLLTAIERGKNEESFVVYTPDGQFSETLELSNDESQFILALEENLSSIKRARPHPGRLRLIIFCLSSLTMISLAGFWIPDIIIKHAISISPKITQTEIGIDLLGRINRVSGPSCTGPSSLPVLQRLANRLDVKQIVVIPLGIQNTLSLPGGITLLNQRIIEDHNNPNIIAGFILAEKSKASQHDPFSDILTISGMMASIRLIITGTIPTHAMDNYIEHILRHDRMLIDTEKLLQTFYTAQVPTTPFAYAKDITGESVIGLIEADPFANNNIQVPILSESDYQILQTICDQ
ncbi:MAG: hypothetical protein OXC62_00655 [Aestuariivita sp.]|nr:hypothetical protein [Aestuariivita sp.]